MHHSNSVLNPIGGAQGRRDRMQPALGLDLTGDLRIQTFPLRRTA
jgi:hypothetical protein